MHRCHHFLLTLLLAAVLVGCDEGEILEPPTGDGVATAALLMDDGNALPQVLVNRRAIPVPLEVLEALPARPGDATRIHLVVDADGTLVSATVVESGGDPALDLRALEAVRARTFPAGHAREFTTSVWLRASNR
jgi:TonB family protein